ncbi:hypothetical protein DH2020_008785 [Rehmannia glutinosa]|uniref:GIR1-like zinc ribbon domain-containing protein n=1 Tax=Rehmannia glutinosa TaxID=99300 RepID=A0ABR0X4E3_REHGL
MAADVSSLVRVMNGGDVNESGKSTAPITRDLLGGCCTLDSKELDLDLQVPCGWEKRLDLKLVSPLSASPSSSNYQSVCTLDKVKSALERAEKESVRKRSISMSKSSSPRSTSSSSVKDGDLDEDEGSTASIAAGCPSCLLYVLISRGNPKCPRCNSNVPLPVAAKKPRIDLNISI